MNEVSVLLTLGMAGSAGDVEQGLRIHGPISFARARAPPAQSTSARSEAAKLSAADVEAVANHFAKLPFVAAKQSFDAQKAAAGEKLHARDCAKCHTKGGRDPADDASILGGQHLKYLQQALADFKKGEREQSKKMAEKLANWSDADIEAVAHYYASLQ